MLIFTIVIHVIVCITLIAVILLQAGRGHGLAGGTFGAEMNTVFGSKTANFMTKLTTTCAVVFLITCLGIDVIISMRGRSLMAKEGGAQTAGLSQEKLDEMMEKLKTMQAEEQAGEETAAQTAAEDGAQAATSAQATAAEETAAIAASGEAVGTQAQAEKTE